SGATPVRPAPARSAGPGCAQRPARAGGGVMTMTMYKVLVNGRSCNGGDLVWSLPRQRPDGSWEAGAWHEVGGPIQVCRNGLHLTRHPVEWWKRGAECYVAEYEGDTDEDRDGLKIAVRRARLLRRLTTEELAALGIWREGHHRVTAGRAIASGSASVEASGSASVVAYDSASVRASGSVSVEASGSASVEAYDSASVEAYDSASVVAYDSASVRASGSVSVEASGSASVEAYDSASVVS